MFSIIRLILAFFAYLLLQIMLFNELTLFNFVTPFVYLLFLFMLPLSIPTTIVYLLAFGMGLMVDMISETYMDGIHAFSALLSVACRRYILNITLPASFRESNEVAWHNQSHVWYAVYLLPLIFIHHLAYYFLEAFSFAHFFRSFFQVISGTIYTFAVCYALCIIFYKRR